MESFWSIKCKRKINSTPEKLWNLISKPGYLNLVHPYCKESTIKSWKKNDHRDILIYLNGLKYERHFNKWEEKKGYSLMIGKKMVKNLMLSGKYHHIIMRHF